ncbi:MAG: response regulator [Opitutaceae bacterium]|jgi:two-component system response regulator MtrA|nr:response regulator [Opitutaceae bacterium]
MKARILIAEDDAGIRPGLMPLLESGGRDVTAAPDGTQALKLYPQSKYDLVVLDIMTPGRGGCDVCREIRERAGASPCFLSPRKAGRLTRSSA